MNAIQRTAEISSCGRYRYRLMRWWGMGNLLPFVMLNPSTANAEFDDPTIRRCMGFARREGADGIVVSNLYAWRATSPEELNRVEAPCGVGNSDALDAIAVNAATSNMPIICAWGAHKIANRVTGYTLEKLRRAGARLVCLGKTADGSPRHPLYVCADAPLVPYP